MGRWAAIPRMRSVVEDPGFADSQPLRRPSSTRWPSSRISGQSLPTQIFLLAMQERVHNYVVAGEGTAKEALDGLVRDWTEVFEDEGKI